MVRRWAYAALLALAVLLVLGTGGFSAMSADRGVSVSVADDEEAYLGYDDTCENGTLKVTITNQFDDRLTDVSITVDGEQKDLPEDAEIEAAKQWTATFNVSGTNSRDVTVEASGPGVSVELDRTAC
ncbi:hypothetical protein [Halapricum desulfuricans]|uniref:Uncharacterized protein n=1 Tax=Halapricum desulfuricans TaxID=2841257 RepID=A0A897MVL4_9EURY|nr:hypothetical protein [Halapricum desulfuricans]QSG06150.1 hypothetical protein HSR121_1816 [Halapricum desulfuricans]